MVEEPITVVLFSGVEHFGKSSGGTSSVMIPCSRGNAMKGQPWNGFKAKWRAIPDILAVGQTIGIDPNFNAYVHLLIIR